MPLVNPLLFINRLRDEGKAVAAFNIHNLETIQAVVAAAEEEGWPLMLQTTPGTVRHAGVDFIAAIARTAADLSSVPIALHVDHCTDFGMIMRCIRAGYTSVMIDCAALPYAENCAAVRRVVEIAHEVGVAVEGELGRIGGVEDGLSVDDRSASFTVPEQAAEFVAATGIDTLAVAIGTAHGVYHGTPDLDFERLAEIKKLVSIPLVLHGASGVPDWQIKKALSLGVAKINIATELKIPMANAIKRVFAEKPEENDPRVYMGEAIKAVKAAAIEKIKLVN